MSKRALFILSVVCAVLAAVALFLQGGLLSLNAWIQNAFPRGGLLLLLVFLVYLGAENEKGLNEEKRASALQERRLRNGTRIFLNLGLLLIVLPFLGFFVFTLHEFLPLWIVFVFGLVFLILGVMTIAVILKNRPSRRAKREE